MAEFNGKRRVIFKSLGAAGLLGLLTGCPGGSGDGSSGGGLGASLGQSSGSGGTVDGTNKLLVDASVDATGIPADIPVYAYITGLVKVPGQVFYRYDGTQSRPVEMSTSDNTITDSSKIQTGLSGTAYQQNYPAPWANYGISLSRTGATAVADLTSFNSINIPGFGKGPAAFSGRIWISVGKPLLPFTPRVGGSSSASGKVDGYTTPVVAAGGIGALCFYDWLEFSFDVDGLLYINTTQVDQYGFPISASATGNDVQGSPQGLYNKKRSEILADLAQLGAPFNTSVEMPTSGVDADAYPPSANTSNKLRALAPSKTPGIATSTYLDAVISSAMANWKNSWLAVTCSSNALQKTYYGKVQADGKTLDFYKDNSGTGAVQFTFNDITTQNVLDCDGTMTGVGVPQTGDLLTDLKNTGKAILAGFNRGVIGSTTTELNIDVGSGYAPPISASYPPAIPSNVWAQHFHEYSANGLAYGFAYDDVGDQQPMIIATKTTNLTLTLGKFE
ncbi:MAG TPA: beta-1,3-glucanase family protein [Eoetvoesiella sp.]|uniref:beta-1,3-glucanase family protein n=1 Tax=Eoetvoesiella sp. TaxID=1966355 RepID=UPI002C2EFCE1|nr:beta-1,3-glucanase family protein [Eoetvoesiella sp.]HWK61931.1 beta-1,3-glucanase family protein [Eoetvoesiella sp.]